jgi:hypothetical protein
VIAEPRTWAAALALLAVAGCARDGWEVALEEGHPELRRLAPHHLGSITPYTLALSGRLTRFLCRWPGGAPIPLSLPRDADPAQRRALEAAAAAWEGAGLGVRFAPVEAGSAARAGIEVELRDDLIAAQADTFADCALDPEALDASDELLPARLVYASVHLSQHDIRLAGTALHELGHALGFQGHVRRGRTVMVGSPRVVWEIGRKVLAGRDFEDAALRALYALPSGLVVERVRLDADQTAPADRLRDIARRLGFAGPWLRVGDREGLLYWRDERGARVKLRIEGLRQSRHEPGALRLVPGPRARKLLDPA